MQDWINALLRENIRALKPYSSARDEFSGGEGIFLDANENAFGSVHGIPPYHRYPDPQQRKLKEKIAQLENVSSEQIFVGNGSDEAIDLLMRAFCEPGQDSILIQPPTYGMYQVSAGIQDVKIIQVPLLENLQSDLGGIREAIQAHTKMIFFCSPNNPSGHIMDQKDIVEVLRYFSGLVVIDEAYVDFCPQYSLVSLLKEHHNLVILRTFSKAWGLAGLRLGLAFAHEDIIKIYNRIKPPYNINSASQEIAFKALEQAPRKQEFVQKIIQERHYLEKNLARIPSILHIYPSETNYLLLKVANAHHIYQYLINHQIIVRKRANLPVCGDCIRITVGTRSENESLIGALHTYKMP